MRHGAGKARAIGFLRAISRATGLALGLLLSAAPAATAQSQCRLALILAFDVSGSVDAREYRQQLDGTAAALDDPEVQAAFLALPGTHVELAAFQWGAKSQQSMLLEWTPIHRAEALSAAAARLRDTAAPFENPQTAIGAAMLYGLDRLQDRDACWTHVMDISGDGPSNNGPFPETIGSDGPPGLTINALVIGPDARDNITKNLANAGTLLTYYRDRVLRGPGAFVITATGYDDYRRAMTAKLLRELRPVAVSFRGTSQPVQ